MARMQRLICDSCHRGIETPDMADMPAGWIELIVSLNEDDELFVHLCSWTCAGKYCASQMLRTMKAVPGRPS